MVQKDGPKRGGKLNGFMSDDGKPNNNNNNKERTRGHIHI
jgi:hypothetical protein